jgi:hypothetical protein
MRLEPDKIKEEMHEATGIDPLKKHQMKSSDQRSRIEEESNLSGSIPLDRMDDTPTGILQHRRLLQCSAGYEVVFDDDSFCFVEAIVLGEEESSGTVPPDQVYSQQNNSSVNNSSVNNTSVVNPSVINPSEPMDLDRETIDRNVEDSYGFLGYLCNDDLDLIEASETDVAAQVGPTVKICVERNAKAVQDGVYIRQIDAFTFYRDSGDIQQVAIVLGGEAAANGLTELHCTRGSHKCWFQTYLGANFFSSEGFVQVLGAATLQFGDVASRRRLHVEHSGRRASTPDDEEDISNARRIQLEFLATTKEAMAEFVVLQRMGRKKDTNWLRYGLAAIGFLLGCVLLSEKKSLIARWKERYRGSTLQEKNEQVGGTGVASSGDGTVASSDHILDLEWCPPDGANSFRGSSPVYMTHPNPFSDASLMVSSSTNFDGGLLTLPYACE